MGQATSNTRNRIDVTTQRTSKKSSVVTEWANTDDGNPVNLFSTSLKIVLMGAPRVGKTSLVKRWLHNSFDTELSSYIPTTKVDIGSKLVQYNDNLLAIEVWDTPSHPDIRNSNFDLYFHNADIVILVGDVSKPASFKDLEDNVVPYLKKYCNRHYQGMLPVMVVMGNKHDLQLDGHVPMVLTEELCEVMTDSYNANFGVLCSARVDIDIDNAFDKAINIARKNHRPQWIPVTPDQLAREKAEEAEQKRRKEEEAAELQRQQAEEEKEMHRIEKELLREQGYDVSDDEDEDLSVHNLVVSPTHAAGVSEAATNAKQPQHLAIPSHIPSSQSTRTFTTIETINTHDDAYDNAEHGEGGAGGNAMVEDGFDEDESPVQGIQGLKLHVNGQEINQHERAMTRAGQRPAQPSPPRMDDDEAEEEEEEKDNGDNQDSETRKMLDNTMNIQAVASNNDDFDEEEEDEEEQQSNTHEQEPVGETPRTVTNNNNEFDQDEEEEQTEEKKEEQEEKGDFDEELPQPQIQAEEEEEAEEAKEVNEDGFDEDTLPQEEDSRPTEVEEHKEAVEDQSKTETETETAHEEKEEHKEDVKHVESAEQRDGEEQPVVVAEDDEFD